jgi:hypothetical protein
MKVFYFPLKNKWGFDVDGMNKYIVVLGIKMKDISCECMAYWNLKGKKPIFGKSLNFLTTFYSSFVYLSILHLKIV